jgi:hypothetical protein
MLPTGAARAKDKEGTGKTNELLEFASAQLKQMYAGKASVDVMVLERMLANLA